MPDTLTQAGNSVHDRVYPQIYSSLLVCYFLVCEGRKVNKNRNHKRCEYLPESAPQSSRSGMLPPPTSAIAVSLIASLTRENKL
jgi:hypothetical protein